jgi:hypothetical protein
LWTGPVVLVVESIPAHCARIPRDARARRRSAQREAAHKDAPVQKRAGQHNTLKDAPGFANNYTKPHVVNPRKPSAYCMSGKRDLHTQKM